MKRSRDSRFFKVLLPGFAAANLGLGLVVLAQLGPHLWLQWLEIATGAFCCAVAGWLAASGWSKSYWGKSMARQVFAWHRMVDAIFAWVEDLPIPAESVYRLKRALEDVRVERLPR
ncbi:MAG TPA: hypothetical protein VLU92_04310 [Candidatus Dormibacteraeota bacterium]|nr:hypothetical protein [Candidatus Dormibacteraeota bacterium]